MKATSPLFIASVCKWDDVSHRGCEKEVNSVYSQSGLSCEHEGLRSTIAGARFMPSATVELMWMNNRNCVSGSTVSVFDWRQSYKASEYDCWHLSPLSYLKIRRRVATKRHINHINWVHSVWLEGRYFLDAGHQFVLLKPIPRNNSFSPLILSGKSLVHIHTSRGATIDSSKC